MERLIVEHIIIIITDRHHHRSSFRKKTKIIIIYNTCTEYFPVTQCKLSPIRRAFSRSHTWRVATLCEWVSVVWVCIMYIIYYYNDLLIKCDILFIFYYFNKLKTNAMCQRFLMWFTFVFLQVRWGRFSIITKYVLFGGLWKLKKNFGKSMTAVMISFITMVC